MMRKQIIGICLGVILCTGCAGVSTHRNVILMIGDGMGLAQVSAGQQTKPDSVFTKFRVTGLVDTRPLGKRVTDSAAAATAMATGHKAKNGVLSLEESGQRLKTVLEYAEEHGKKTGMVTTCSITHATPAAFYAHVANRSQDAQIAEFIPASGLDVYFGSGWSFLVPNTIPESKRPDARNIMAELEAKGYTVVRSVEEFKQIPDTTQTVLGFLAPEHLPKAAERTLSSAAMTEKALGLLQASPKGFFLMVEGSQIDWACHQNDASGLLAEMNDFEGAVKSALDFVAKNPETLLIVTADHETGGVVLHNSENVPDYIKFETKDHSSTLVPLFAMGPESERFGGIQQNSELGEKLIKLVSGNE